MDTVQHEPPTASASPGTPSGARSSAALPPWRLNVMRVGYLVMGVGLAITKWPELVHHESWELMRGTVVTMLVAAPLWAHKNLTGATRGTGGCGLVGGGHHRRHPLASRDPAVRPGSRRAVALT